MAEVFISYARANEAAAKRVANGLNASGLDVWFDEQLPAHRAYSEIIEEKLQSSNAVIVLWSMEAAQSQWVRAEADFARTHGKLVQAQLDDTLPPMPFNQIQCADLRNWRRTRKHRGWVKLVESVASVIAGEPQQPAEPPPASRGLRMDRRLAVAAVALLLLVAGAIFIVPRLFGGDDGPPRIAVLPFDSVEGSNASLVAGIWEDTRQALSRNPQLVVLGPNTSEELAERGNRAARRAADYLVEGSVRTAADRVRVSTSLVRSKDGAQIWSQTFDRKLDDVFALQSHIAQEIEGRIRGRLARGGGIKPENIATTGEAYALYSEARAAIRRRDHRGYVAAHGQLKQALAIDPNFAPAWATLSVAEYITQPTLLDGRSTGKEAEAYARRAITLAPNLAPGHAALGLALGLSGPRAETALRRAITLNPNDIETLNFLASLERRRGRWREALGLYNRAVQIEPLWWPAVLNRLSLWIDRNQESVVENELARLERLGDDHLKTFAKMTVLEWRGDLSEAVKIGLAFYRRTEPSKRSRIEDYLASLLLRLGHDDLAWQFSNAPPNARYMWRSDPRGIAIFEARNIPPVPFWKISPLAEVVSRTYVTMGREARLLEIYKAAVASPDEFLNLVEHPVRFLQMAPIVAVAFQRTGEQAEAERLLAGADKVLEETVTTGMNLRERAIFTARVRAVQGRHAEAVAELREAIRRGWSPYAPYFKPDLQDDTALALLKGIPEFQQLRARTLAHLAKEREDLGPIQHHGR